VNARLPNGQTPLHLAASVAAQGCPTACSITAPINALTALDEPALHFAIVQGHAETADLLMERGPWLRGREIAGLLAPPIRLEANNRRGV